VSVVSHEWWERHQQRMLTGQTRVLRETANGSRIMSIELTPYGREQLTVRVPLRPEVRPPRSRHRRAVKWTLICLLWAAFSFALGVSATSCVMMLRDALVHSEPDVSERLATWLIGVSK